MRLICPNCDAQYEVDSAVIPAEGRDVQCSNCGTTWFQDPEAEPAAPLGADVDEAAGGDPAPEAGAAAARRRPLDDAVASVLREEAEREAGIRRAEGTSVEVQAEMGLTSAAAIVTPAPAEPAPVVQDDTDPALIPRASRRELLPDIEEINSTLRPMSERGGELGADGSPEYLALRRSGFRRGFVTSLLGMSLLLLPYVFADEISRGAPSSAPAIARYSAAIDGMRIWLEGAMKSTTENLRDDDQG